MTWHSKEYDFSVTVIVAWCYGIVINILIKLHLVAGLDS